MQSLRWITGLRFSHQITKLPWETSTDTIHPYNFADEGINRYHRRKPTSIQIRYIECSEDFNKNTAYLACLLNGLVIISGRLAFAFVYLYYISLYNGLQGCWFLPVLPYIALSLAINPWHYLIPLGWNVVLLSLSFVSTRLHCRQLVSTRMHRKQLWLSRCVDWTPFFFYCPLLTASIVLLGLQLHFSTAHLQYWLLSLYMNQAQIFEVRIVR